MPIRTVFDSQAVRAYSHDPNLDWNDTNWSRVWSQRVRRRYIDSLNRRSTEIVIRGELLRLLNLAEQVGYIIIKMSFYVMMQIDLYSEFISLLKASKVLFCFSR